MMNIFATSDCPIESAKFLDDKRANKMCLESAQLLSSALRLCGYTGDDVYKISHKNHPSNLWARATQGNYKWLLEHFKALCNEYNRRTGKIHASSKLLPIFEANVGLIPMGERQPFSNNARNLTKGVDFTHETNVTLAYQLYLLERWNQDKREPKWS
jgi:hypothetical protein